MVPNDPHLRVFTVLCSSLLCCSRDLWPIEKDRSDNTSILRLGCKRHCGFHLGGFFSLTLGSFVLGDINLWAALERGSHGKETKLLPTATWMGLILQPSWKSSETAVNTCSLRDLSHNDPAETLPDSWPPETGVIINICCFKLLSLGVFYYISNK